MKPIPVAYTQISAPTDEGLFVTLIKQADALEVAVRRAERKVKQRTTLRADILLALAVVGFIITFGLAVSPYLNLDIAVPQVIAYVSAFAVLVLGYLIYLAYGNSAAAHDLARRTRLALEDGTAALTRAFATLEAARSDEAALPEGQARIECAIAQAEQATARLQNLESEKRIDVDDVIKVHIRPRSSVLAGIIGGFAGASIGIYLATIEVPLAVTGPIGAAIGIAVALLMWRGPSQWRVERATDRTEQALALYYKELNSPESQVPEGLRGNTWGRYDRLLASYAALAERAVGGRYGIPAPRRVPEESAPTQPVRVSDAVTSTTP